MISIFTHILIDQPPSYFYVFFFTIFFTIIFLAIEITASIAGVVNGGTGPYGTSKHAALAIAEALYAELRNRSVLDRMSVVALCPAIVETALRQTSLKVAEYVKIIKFYFFICADFYLRIILFFSLFIFFRSTRDGLRGAVGR